MRIDLQIPTSWPALTSEQLREVVQLWGMGLSREDYLLVLFCRFAGLKMLATKAQEEDKTVVRLKFKYAATVFSLEDWQVADFCGRLSFVLDEDMPIGVQWPFRWNRFLMDTTFGNWFHADAMMLGYSLQGDIERLKGAMKDLGDPHPDLQPNDPDVVLMLKWYELFMDWMQERYPLVLQKAKPGSETASNPIEARQNIMLMLNDGKPQDNEKIEQSNLHDVLSALQHKIEEAKHVEELLKERN